MHRWREPLTLDRLGLSYRYLAGPSPEESARLNDVLAAGIRRSASCCLAGSSVPAALAADHAVQVAALERTLYQLPVALDLLKKRRAGVS